MEQDTSYEMLWQVTQKEKQSNELQPLPKTFYDDVSSYLKQFDKKELSDDEANTKKNTLKLLNELYDRRKQKVLIYVAYKKQLPQPAILKEQEFYNLILEETSKNTINISSIQKQDTKVLRTLQALPEIILPSGRKLGPVEKGQLIEVSNKEDDIKFLINTTICEQI
ncbi:MAG: hypothetical protein M1504_03865 [Candidatus Marsarchaeota archaeon]|nr:hypothetical protein [Candidatus Marsarchaeota archaeon]